jgi:hypothetical protein
MVLKYTMLVPYFIIQLVNIQGKKSDHSALSQYTNKVIMLYATLVCSRLMKLGKSQCHC